MRGGLRWPNRPSQVTCVLVAVLLTAASSLKCGFDGLSCGRPSAGNTDPGGPVGSVRGDAIATASAGGDNAFPAVAFHRPAAGDRADDVAAVSLFGRSGPTNVREASLLECAGFEMSRWAPLAVFQHREDRQRAKEI